MNAIQGHDERIGLCIDIGHTLRSGVDPAKAALKCRDRLYDMHLKDETKAAANGSPVEAGRGALDLKSLFEALLKIKYSHMAEFEYEKDGDDPLPGLSESVGYCKGLLAT
jgi:sugar phosphate isomerase/epimerase